MFAIKSGFVSQKVAFCAFAHYNVNSQSRMFGSSTHILSSGSAPAAWDWMNPGFLWFLLGFSCLVFHMLCGFHRNQLKCAIFLATHSPYWSKVWWQETSNPGNGSHSTRTSVPALVFSRFLWKLRIWTHLGCLKNEWTSEERMPLWIALRSQWQKCTPSNKLSRRN